MVLILCNDYSSLIPICSEILIDTQPKQYNSVLKILRAGSRSGTLILTDTQKWRNITAHNLPALHSLFYSLSTPPSALYKKRKEYQYFIAFPANPVNVTFIPVSELYNPFSRIKIGPQGVCCKKTVPNSKY